MAAHDYHLSSLWRVRADIDEVAAILEDASILTRWWPEVYLDVREITAGDAGNGGNAFAIHSRGWLPYTLKWTLRVSKNELPHRLAVTAEGDLTGEGEWRLTQSTHDTELKYDWCVRADKPLLRILSPILKPVFAANHRWAMAKGEAGLKRELDRRRAAGD